MDIVSFLNVSTSEKKVQIDKLSETSFSKEIRICMAKDSVMQEHTAPDAITILIIKGRVRIDSLEESKELNNGDMVYFNAKVPHSLEALEDSVIRLTLSKHDSEQRVFSLVENIPSHRTF
ncbi:cupin domain-containing protein [Sulfurimonas marina]|uniref:Cupin domain-containing protein n=1 Tax=Sulfurimonas marina TaxID=2590551 RepID=A0A7M1AVL0_9BACT|nr:cupin domain-containing protein [Sulfurimonas marina]QOP41479.1 cupin domain-containing protein [Sulfurimonas marina]